MSVAILLGNGDGLSCGRAPLIGRPLYEAGPTAGDRSARVAAAPVLTTTALRDLLATRRPGTPLRLTWIGRTGERTASVTLAEDPNVEVVAFEEGGRAPTAAQLAFRAAWVGSRIR
ncbi:MAG: hypothetical protein ACO3SD_01340 [Gemmatimonadaceae bacterium]